VSLTSRLTLTAKFSLTIDKIIDLVLTDQQSVGKRSLHLMDAV
jgi:hypothetical protein